MIATSLIIYGELRDHETHIFLRSSERQFVGDGMGSWGDGEKGRSDNSMSVFSTYSLSLLNKREKKKIVIPTKNQSV